MRNLHWVTLHVANKFLDIFKQLDLEEPYYDKKEIYRGETKKVRQFFVVAFRERVRLYLPLGILFILLIVPLDRYVSVQPVQLSGLIFDLTGAVILGVGLIRSEVGIERDSTTIATSKLGGTVEARSGSERQNRLDPLSVSSEARDTVDAFFGLSFLFIGFSLQIISELL